MQRRQAVSGEEVSTDPEKGKKIFVLFVKYA